MSNIDYNMATVFFTMIILKLQWFIYLCKFGIKSPIFFTTNKVITTNGYSYSVYDVNLTKYTKSVWLDGYNTR